MSPAKAGSGAYATLRATKQLLLKLPDHAKRKDDFTDPFPSSCFASDGPELEQLTPQSQTADTLLTTIRKIRDG